MKFSIGRVILAAGLNVWAVSMLIKLIRSHHGDPHFQLFLLTIVFLLCILSYFAVKLYGKLPEDTRLLGFRVYATGVVATAITLTYLALT